MNTQKAEQRFVNLRLSMNLKNNADFNASFRSKRHSQQGTYESNNTISIEDMKFVVYDKDHRCYKYQPFANDIFKNQVARIEIHDTNNCLVGFDPIERQVFYFGISERGLSAGIYWRPQDPNYFARISTLFFAANELYMNVRLECSDDIFDFSMIELDGDSIDYELDIKEIYLSFS